MKLYNWRLIAFIAVMTVACGRAHAATIDWTAVTLNAAFDERVHAGLITTTSKMVIIGGANNAYTLLNDVWMTSNGFDWTAVTRNAAFSPRWKFSSVFYNNYMWVIGGVDASGTLNDVWYSASGVDWYAATRNAEFGAMFFNKTIVFNDKMYLFTDATINPMKVWSSTSGLSWELVTQTAKISTRDVYNALVFDSKMWIIAGEAGTGSPYAEVYSSTNGVDWVAVTKNAEFGARSYGAAFVYDSKMWIVGGVDATGNIPSGFLADAWYSTDGAAWTEDTSNAAFGAKGFTHASLFNAVPYVVSGWDGAGGYEKDVWSIAAGTTPTFTQTPATATPTTYQTRTITPTRTATVHTATNTPSVTRTITHTVTATPTNTVLITFTDTPTITATFTDSPTSTETPTITETWTISETITASPTMTITLTATPIETIILWHSLNAGYGAPNDTEISWRQYPDTTDNKVQYTLYITNVTEATEPPRIISVPNVDDIDASSFVFGYVLQGLTGGDCYSVTITAEGGDLGVSFMSNNIQICPEIRTQIDIAGVTPIYGGFVVSSVMHLKTSGCKIGRWEYYKALAANASDYIGIVHQGSFPWHWRADLTTANGIAQVTPYRLAEIGAAGTTATAFFFGRCTPTMEVPIVYSSTNTTTAGTQSNISLTIGGADAGNPSATKSGSETMRDVDWLETYGAGNVFYLKVTAGDSATKVWLALEGYVDDN